MPTAKQNALVRQHCAVCHTDAAKNDGLSLEHFDAATAAPSLAAMLLSKLSGGVALEMVREMRTNPEPAALVHKNMRHGAMDAAGIPIPDQTTIDGLVQALAVESTGATEWSVSRSPAGVTASILREVPSSKCDVEAYRLIALARWRPRRVRFQWLGHRRHSAEILLLPWMERPGSFCSGRQRSDGQRKTA